MKKFIAGLLVSLSTCCSCLVQNEAAQAPTGIQITYPTPVKTIQIVYRDGKLFERIDGREVELAEKPPITTPTPDQPAGSATCVTLRRIGQYGDAEATYFQFSLDGKTWLNQRPGGEIYQRYWLREVSADGFVWDKREIEP